MLTAQPEFDVSPDDRRIDDDASERAASVYDARIPSETQGSTPAESAAPAVSATLFAPSEPVALRPYVAILALAAFLALTHIRRPR